MPSYKGRYNPMIVTMRGSSMADRKNPSRQKRPQSSAPYSSKIIKAGALIGDTKTLLSHWDVKASVAENINRLQRDNVFGKASRSRLEDILAIFRQRYLAEESVTRALVVLVRRKFPTAALGRLLYFHSARADRLLHDAVTEILVPMQAQGLVDMRDQSRVFRLQEGCCFLIQQDPQPVNTDGCAEGNTEQVEHGDHNREDSRPLLKLQQADPRDQSGNRKRSHRKKSDTADQGEKGYGDIRIRVSLHPDESRHPAEKQQNQQRDTNAKRSQHDIQNRNSFNMLLHCSSSTSAF